MKPPSRTENGGSSMSVSRMLCATSVSVSSSLSNSCSLPVVNAVSWALTSVMRSMELRSDTKSRPPAVP